MTALGFKKQFAGAVERREKRRSIRAKGDRFKVGKPIQLYTGMRTKACRKLVAEDPICVSVQPVVISAHAMTVDGVALRPTQRIDMAHEDGFASWHDFVTFFAAQGSMPWSGYLIRWEWPA